MSEWLAGWLSVLGGCVYMDRWTLRPVREKSCEVFMPRWCRWSLSTTTLASVSCSLMIRPSVTRGYLDSWCFSSEGVLRIKAIIAIYIHFLFMQLPYLGEEEEGGEEGQRQGPRTH